jgi:cytoskeletal protein CcmA (bactofilin family)
VEGDVHAKSRVEIHSTGKVYGTLFTPILIISEGGILEGNCKMKGSPDKKEDNADSPSSKTDNPLSI